MHKRKILGLIVIFLIVTAKAWGADKVFLKTGKVVEGEITLESPIFVRVRISPMSTREFLLHEIDRIEYDSPEETAKAVNITDEKGEVSDPADSTEIAVNSEPLETQEEGQVTVVLDKEMETEIASPSEESFSTPGESAAVAAVAPTKIVISKDSPAPMPTSSYSPNPYSGGYQGQYPSPQTGLSQTDMMQRIAEAPHVFNDEAYNGFLDETISTEKKLLALREKQFEALNQAAEVRPSMFPFPGNQRMADEFKEKAPKIIISIAIGIGLPILIGLILFLYHVFKPAADKESKDKIRAEIEALEKMKSDGTITDEEYTNLIDEAKKQATESSLRAYLVSIPKIFMYPLRMPVLLATCGATVLFYIVRIAMNAPFYGFFATIFAYCYFVACIVKIIETAVRENREDIFDWPSYTEMVDWFGKAFLFLIGWLICHGTALLILFNFFKYEAIQLPVISVSVAFFLIGMFVYPMYMLSMSLVGGAASLNIVNIIRAINTTYISYLITMIVLLMTQILSAVAQIIPTVLHIPLFSSLFKWFIFVYFFLVNMRLLGIFYKSHRKILRWYGEDDND